MVWDSENTFIDSHCHLFNMIDVPVYETLEGRVSMGTLANLFTAIGVLAGSVFGQLDNKVREYKGFIQFFERSQDENIRALVADIQKAHKGKNLVINPMIMDFDCSREDCGKRAEPCDGRLCPIYAPSSSAAAQDPTAEQQLLRIHNSINILSKPGGILSDDSVRILPFIGFDLRKLTPVNSRALRDLQDFWGTHGIRKSQGITDFGAIENGKAIGIKLYPPMGFNPYPRKNNRALAKYVEFFEWCITEDIPITVHCQPSSFSTARSQRGMDADTNPSNWYKLFGDWNNLSGASIDDLRINFAHFGGEKGLKEMFKDCKIGQFNKDSWTYPLVKLLKEYPKTYADISAFDWGMSAPTRHFGKIMILDQKKKFGNGGHDLRDKLMWGTDIPMKLSSDSYKRKMKHQAGYKYYYDNYLDSVKKIKKFNDPQGFVDQMATTTPMAFLLG